MEGSMSGKTTNPARRRATSRAPLIPSVIEDLRRKGYNQSEIAEMHGVTRQAVSWQTTKFQGKSKAYQRLRDHGEYMRVGSFKTMSEDKRKRLLSWWKMLRDNDLVVEFDPNIEPYPGMAGGGFRYVPRTIEDDDLLIRVNEHTNLTDEGEMIWCWPPDIEELLN
ncbi:repressor [Mycobacterium phage Chy5]|uniref:transcriptional repressor n=1 Tax=Mycobacterium phage Chy5 TaxID=1327948 RepID=UPI00032B4D23|nr:transcriptional repressor [Mycobacterium phage Chy5]AGK86105.1 repressor [Mycobacterium phage Chy5]